MERPYKAASGIERTAKEGVPIFDGTPELLPYYREEAIQYMFTFETHKRYLAGPRLAKELSGVARTIVRKKNLQNPQWLANPRGVYALLEHLEAAMERPSLVQASQLVSRFFFNLKRRRQESMTQWINRHSEALWEASRALKRVQEEFNPKASRTRGSRRSSTSTRMEPGAEQDDFSRGPPRDRETFDDYGRLPEDEDDDDAQRDDEQWTNASWSGWSWWQASGWNMQDWHQAEYEPPNTWHTEEEDFLPDFLVGFLLLHRSGLDANERANILAAIRGEFSVAAVSKALREQWGDEDLLRRDRKKEHAMWADVSDDEDAIVAEDLIAPDPYDEPEAFAAFQEEQHAIDDALEAIAQNRKTLKDARWRQHQVKMNRRFYPMKGRSDGGKGRGGPSSSSGKGKEKTTKCLRCGGSHATQACPQKGGSIQHAEEEAEIAFVTMAVATDNDPPDTKDHTDREYNLERYHGMLPQKIEDVFGAETEDILSAEAALTNHRDVIASGMGIVDCGATASLASVDALEAIMRLNLKKGHDDKVTVLPGLRPTFRFGNGERKECISSVHLRVDMAERTGKMQLHVHDTPEQPALVSVKALKQLGAVIDFSTNQCVFQQINPCAVVQLEAADNGHLLMPLASNLLEKASYRKTVFQGLSAE
ncbi:unnamed protein product [Symbiodinium pilosum]|uniref:Uncharacterized protein n=1 Tax=Symbiodinium pilosum TaxID=2952 RepID=A0A812P4G5_SYMPI|nr:unnamed protein product [Symbiodinium pilosum]